MITTIILLVLLLTIVSIYAVFVTKRALLLSQSVAEAEIILSEESEVVVEALRSITKVHHLIDVVSKYPVAENSEHVQLIVKTVNSARKELEQLLERYTIE